MIFIAALKLLSPTKLNVFSPAFVRTHTERCFGGGGAGFGAGLGVGLAAATFFGAAFFAGAFFFAAGLDDAVFFGVGMSPPIAVQVSITGCSESWFDTGCVNSIVWLDRSSTLV